MHFTPGISLLLRRAALAVTLAMGCGMASAGTIHVVLDSASLGADSGYLDMQLSTRDGPLTTALVDNMVGFGAVADSWGVTAAGGGFLFRSDTVNDLFLAANFGGLLSFDLSFGGDVDPAGLAASHFLLAAYGGADGLTPLGRFNPANSSLADFGWQSTAIAGVDGALSASLSDPAVTFVPEPQDLFLVGAGLAVMALALRRRRAPGSGNAGLAVGLAA